MITANILNFPLSLLSDNPLPAGTSVWVIEHGLSEDSVNKILSTLKETYNLQVSNDDDKQKIIHMMQEASTIVTYNPIEMYELDVQLEMKFITDEVERSFTVIFYPSLSCSDK